MNKDISNIFGSESLPAEMLAALQEAFDAKIVESEKRIRAEAETAIREEFSARFSHDKANLVEALDMCLTDAVKENARKKNQELAKLTETRAKLDKTIRESKKVYNTKLHEHVGMSKTLITENLKKTILSLNEQKAELAKKTTVLEAAFKKLKVTMAEQQTSRLAKMDEFVVRRLTHELTEFAQDHRALNETRAKLIKENKAKLKDTQTRFVAEAAKKVETAINENLKREMAEMHEDIERNRQNTFGRRIFEAIAGEYMTSYLAEGTEIRNLQNILESKEQELNAVKSKLTETAKAAETAGRKEKLAEDRATRTKIMGELLGNLRGDKRAVMTSMLESTRTEGLRSAFDRLLPVVLSETTRKPTADRKTAVLTENRAPARRSVEVTGDKPARIVESSNFGEDDSFNADLGSILRLAGIQK